LHIHSARPNLLYINKIHAFTLFWNIDKITSRSKKMRHVRHLFYYHTLT